MGKPTLFLAAGHGGTDRGNVTTGIVERDELIKIVDGMNDWCVDNGITQGLGGVIFLDHGLDLAGELKAIEAWKPSSGDGDLCIDWHLDFKYGNTAGGSLVLYDETPYAGAFATQWLDKWCAGTGIKNNGAHRSADVAKRWRGWDDYGFCRPRWPGVIIELGCLNRPADMEVVRADYYRALAIQLALDIWKQVRGT